MRSLQLCQRAPVAVAAVISLMAGGARAQSYGLTERPIIGAYLDGVMPETAPTLDTNWSTVIAFPNLTFQNSLGLIPMPGTNKLVVWEREGRVYSFDNDPNASTKTLILDLHDQCQGWDDCGLLGLAFHPDFATNGYVYVWYNWVSPGTVVGSPTSRPSNSTTTHQRLARYTIDPGTGIADPASEYIVIDQIAHNLWHNGGGMFFHPNDGFLYLTNGNDANGGNDQRITGGLFGCVLRIDVDKRGGNISHAPTRRANEEVGPNWPESYYVPNDNPFVGVPGALEEIHALGLRSPHRMTIDPPTGRIFIGDVGEGTWEEIDTIDPNDPGGLNFQWNRIEGYNGDLVAPYVGVNRRPLLAYGHDQNGGNAVIGGYVYRGSEFPELFGKYLFADNTSNRIWVLDESTASATTPASKVLIATMPKGSGPNSGNDYTGISSWGFDADGELYLCQLSSLGGYIYKLQRGGPPPGTPLPATLSETGVFSDMDLLTANSGLVPYGLNQPFWSDGAQKSRWAAVPAGTTVGFHATGEWDWPAGSVLVKHFELPVDDTNPAIRRRLETRLLVKTESGAVYGASYKWRADQSEADLMDSALTENIAIAIPPVGDLISTDIGSPADAGSTSRDGDLLTIEAGGLDIWNASDEFRFAYQQRSGDFDISIRVESLEESDLYAKVGLMARESLAPDSRHVFALAFPSNASRSNNEGGYEFQYRSQTGGTSSAIYPTAPQPLVTYPNTWLRLRREGDTFISFSSSDGVTWSEFARTSLTLPSDVYFGVAVTAHSGGATTTANVHLQSTRLQPWYYPSRSDCLTCHTAAAGGVLGPKTRQLNGDFSYPNSVVDNQIRSWAHVGLFDSPPMEDEIPAFDRVVAVDEAGASLEKRARSFLDVNCSSCHRPGGVNALWDARFDTPLAQQGLIYGPVINNLGDPLARVISPQSTAHSVLFRRLTALGGGIQMPPLARNKLDEQSVSLIEEWIESLPVSPPPTVALVSPPSGSVFLPVDMPVALSATASDEDGVARVEFYDGDSKVGEASAEPFEIEWYASWIGRHWLTAVATDETGSSAASPSVIVDVVGSLMPPPIGQDDVGSVGIVGSGDYADGVFTVVGSGSDIWGNADGFRFVYRPLTGDGEVIVRVNSLQNTDGWAKAGAMIRESLDAGSRYAFSMIAASAGASFQLRRNPNTDAEQPHNTGGLSAPIWLKLTRNGNLFHAYRSADGISWTSMGGDETIPMGATVYAGIAVTAHNNSAAAEAVFDHLAFVNADTMTYSLGVNFQPAEVVAPDGFMADTGGEYGVQSGGLLQGWESDRSGTPLSRMEGPDVAHFTLIPVELGAIWELKLPNARYNLRVVAGDPTEPDGNQDFRVEGQVFLQQATNSASPFVEHSGTVDVSDGRLTIAVGSSAANAKLCFVEISSYEVAANIAPTVALTSPFTGAAFGMPGTITLVAKTSDPDGPISGVDFLADDVVIGHAEEAPYTFDWTNPDPGTYSLTARAEDILGGQGTSLPIVVTAKAGNNPPTIELMTPGDGFSNLSTDALEFNADANDSDGSIARVEFWADNVKLAEVAESPYSWNWSAPHSEGERIVWAVAVDNSGASTNSEQVTVTTMPLTLSIDPVPPNGGGGEMIFSLHTVLPVGRAYVLEWSEDLVHWMPLRSGVSDGEPVQVDDEPGNATSRFYRLRVTN